ncbi:dTDP-4-amino-4,6-dideoxygalactose transaminase [Bacillus sp. S/N-304-OC-R1]|uniref:dTDP-4-amino-4,6-dideoxygalactose transaminase n=1 Tax=Bacillus sp. S/N-304-OC-R1 TaxID=2758034 RepID=UPI001C8E756A|nr:dTDP-4-amino-4,6-dideoxygalactose transaminase [Bacillus sp. S/N-304-OC-R1]MBY0124242.1 dTDP-4-amino-4,6-dideoxygalactose transaminase [Bacillus sp. S/N-304-OC-R1]
MIPFNIPLKVENQIKYINMAIDNDKISGNGDFTKRCERWIETRFNTKKSLLTTSCTHSLEMAAILLNIQDGDEVIMPSYTFVSTANAFVLRGAKIVFVDIRKDTMNIDETKIEKAITNRTKVIVPVHYAGVSCEMDTIMKLADQYNLWVVEDAAQGMMSTYKNKALGTIGHLGTYSFHETKNYSCGEGGSLLINDDRFLRRAEIIREKGTDRSSFFRGEVAKYSWVDVGSSYELSELNAACLLAHLEQADLVNEKRRSIWSLYYSELQNLQDEGLIELPIIPLECQHNAHIFYIKTNCLKERTSLLAYLKSKNVYSAFHYVPLHSSKFGLTCGEFAGEDVYTTIESDRLLRLPLYYSLTNDQVLKVCKEIKEYYQSWG